MLRLLYLEARLSLTLKSIPMTLSQALVVKGLLVVRNTRRDGRERAVVIVSAVLGVVHIVHTSSTRFRSTPWVVAGCRV